MQTIIILLVLAVTGCAMEPDIDSYTCSDTQMVKVQQQCDYMMKVAGYEGTWAYRHSVQMNCDLKK